MSFTCTPSAVNRATISFSSVCEASTAVWSSRTSGRSMFPPFEPIAITSLRQRDSRSRLFARAATMRCASWRSSASSSRCASSSVNRRSCSTGPGYPAA